MEAQQLAYFFWGTWWPFCKSRNSQSVGAFYSLEHSSNPVPKEHPSLIKRSQLQAFHIIVCFCDCCSTCLMFFPCYALKFSRPSFTKGPIPQPSALQGIKGLVSVWNGFFIQVPMVYAVFLCHPFLGTYQ